MKLGLFLATSCLVIGVSSAPSQTVYSVPANSRGNQLMLTIANESRYISAEDVEVRTVKHSAAVTFKPESQFLKVVPAQKESDVVFVFDVGRGARVNSLDTLEFVVKDKVSMMWKKLVIVTYTAPKVFALEQNFPNPFNPTTTIYYQLPTDSRVSIVVYDLLGREVKRLLGETKEAGYHQERFDASGIASGVYFYRMTAEALDGQGKNNYVSTKKFVVLK
ncbi:MAG: T9SS type A sorting domain-containing protein [Bacteroidota bacterium]